MIVFIDGENFRQRLVETLMLAGIISDKHARFDIDIPALLRSVLDKKSLKIKYYASEVRLPRGHELSSEILDYVETVKDRRRRWFTQLRAQNIEYVKAGTLKVRQGLPCRNCHAVLENLQEKGVDVRLALDIFESSLDKKNREIAVFSSDVDICPALHKVKKRGVKVIYVCFEKFLNRGTSAAADETVKISTETIAEFIKTY